MKSSTILGALVTLASLPVLLLAVIASVHGMAALAVLSLAGGIALVAAGLYLAEEI